MKWSGTKLFIAGLLCLLSLSVRAEERYDRYVERYKSGWNSLIPRYFKTQFAGSMGVISIGPGWNYAKDKLETDLLIGFIPKFSDRKRKMTLTIKQNYMPWRKHYGTDWIFEPLACGIYINSILDNRFWAAEPGKYPSGYYKFSTKIRFHVFVGQRITFKLSEGKKRRHHSLTAYYEISSCDLYIVSAATNKYLKPSDYLSLSFGIKAQIF